MMKKLKKKPVKAGPKKTKAAKAAPKKKAYKPY